MNNLALVLFFGLVALFTLRTWKARGRLSGRDRWAVITSFAVAITTFVSAPLLIDWVITPTALWLIAVALLTSGVAGAAKLAGTALVHRQAPDPARPWCRRHAGELRADHRRGRDLKGHGPQGEPGLSAEHVSMPERVAGNDAGMRPSMGHAQPVDRAPWRTAHGVQVSEGSRGSPLMVWRE